MALYAETIAAMEEYRVRFGSLPALPENVWEGEMVRVWREAVAAGLPVPDGYWDGGLPADVKT